MTETKFYIFIHHIIPIIVQVYSFHFLKQKKICKWKRSSYHGWISLKRKGQSKRNNISKYFKLTYESLQVLSYDYNIETQRDLMSIHQQLRMKLNPKQNLKRYIWSNSGNPSMQAHYRIYLI